MTDQSYKSVIIEADLKATFHLLRNSFPKLDQVPLRESILTSPLLVALAKRLQLNIPINAYPSQLISLHQQLTEDYYQHICRLTSNNQAQSRQIDVSSQSIADIEENQLDRAIRIDTQKASKAKQRVNYNQLANFVLKFNASQQSLVSQQLIQMGRAFSSWSTKEVDSVFSPRPQLQKRQSRQQPAEIKFGKQKSQKIQPVHILLGKNISLASREMRQQIIHRAQNNKFLEQKTNLSILEKTRIQINYILNRITEEYFDDFRQELKPFVKNQYYSFVICQQILVKVLEEHNFINIYCKLITSIKNEIIELEAQKYVEFKYIFVQKLQQTFYALIRNGTWQGRQQLYKKQLIGMSLFVGQLFHMHILSKNIFPDIFYEIVHNYILQYHLYSNDKSVYYYQVYIQCIIKIIQKMGKYYDQLTIDTNSENIQTILEEILNINNPTDFNFKHKCNYINLLKQINIKLPSQRFKITFLLEDFKCSKVLKKQQENIQFQFVKKLLSIDINQQQEINHLPEMIARVHSGKMMKHFFFQFAEGNIKKVNKNIQIFRIIAYLPNICDSAIDSFKNSVEDLYLVESDFPFLIEGVAKILKIVCDIKKIEFSQLKLGEQDHPEEDIRDFLQNIEGKFYKLIMQD